MSLMSDARQNLMKLANNSYPGRGIILGQSASGRYLIQVYWIMGRSANSRNRLFELEDNAVRAKAFDAAEVQDPTLIHYYPARIYKNFHIISNGDQTDTIVSYLQREESFVSALNSRTFEPDAPNYTPRIAGMFDLDDPKFAYTLAIVKTMAGDPATCQHQYFFYHTAVSGIGHCLHTYAGDGQPLPSFAGEPYPVPLWDTLDEVAAGYWKLLNDENKISLLVKFIDKDTKETRIKLLNKNLGD